MAYALQIDGLDASYGNRQVLHQISMDVAEGDRVLFIGPNGSGKTTLLKCVMGLLRSPGGRVQFYGEDIYRKSVAYRVGIGISYLLQTGNVVPGLTVEENLRLGAFGVKEKDFQKRKAIVLDTVHFLKHKENKRAGLLSGGERQSLALSMVFMKNPRLLLLDEPSAGLSPKAAKDIISLIERLQAGFGVKSICMVEHNLKLALQWASSLVVLLQGQIAFKSRDPGKFVQNPAELENYYFGPGERVQ
jgi:branched-chain amino acid transport system ATP-binding protein